LSPSKASSTGERDFRWRGEPRAVARVHAVFAAALVACVVARVVAQRSSAWVSSVSDAVCVLLAILTWRGCTRFARRYGLDDPLSRTLQIALVGACVGLCVVLARADVVGELESRVHAGDRAAQAAFFALHGAGFALGSALLAALDARAWSARIQLQLDSVERVKTKSMLHFDLFLSAAFSGATAWAWALRETSWPWPLLSLAALVPASALHAWSTARAVERYRGKVPDAPRTR